MFGRPAGSGLVSNRRRRFANSLRAAGIRRKLLAFLLLLVVAVALLPIIVAKTPLRNVLLSMALPKDTVSVTIGDASLSWITSPSLSNVVVKDTAGDTLLAAESIRIDRTPVSLAMNSRELGTMQIIRPTVHLKVRPDGSNLEDMIQKLIGSASPGDTQSAPEAAAKPASDAAAQAPAKAITNRPLLFAVQLVEATVVADDAATGRQWRLQNVNVQYDAHGAASGLGAGSANGEIVVADRGAAPLPAGRFSLSLKPGDGGREELGFQADGVALAIAEPWLRRFAAGSELTGTLSGQATAAWSAGQSAFPNDLTSAGTLSIDRLVAASPALAGDRVRLARMELPWRIVAQPSGLAIEDLQMRSDVGQIAVRGRLDPRALASAEGGPASPSFVAGHHDLEVRGSVDVAKLAAMLPHALRIRGDTTITSGTIELAGSLKPTADGQAIIGSLTTAQLAGTSAGKSIRWDQPVNANISIRRANGTLALDSLKCDSKFLRVEAAGTQQQLNANAYFDLNALAEQLGQFVDLSGIQLAGTGTAQVAWQQPANDKFSATAASDLSQLRVTLSDGAVWSEPQLALRAEAGGSIDPATRRPTRVDAAQLQINGQGDQLDARLTSAVGLTESETVWPVTIRSSGSIARWLTRARPWFTPDPWKIDGTSEVTANVRVTGSAFESTNTKLVVTDLRATSPDWNINESRVEFAGDARWDRATGALAANTAQFVTSTVAVATKDVRYGGNPNGPNQFSGAAAFRADLARLAAWRVQPNQGPQFRPSGAFTGNVRFVQQAGRIVGEVTATGQNLALASLGSNGPANRAAAAGYQTIWQEPRLTIHGASSYDSAADRLSFDQFQIQSNTLQANAAGQIQKLSTVAECELNGTLNYDLAQVTPLLQPYVGAGIQLAGREQARFVLAGKLSDGGLPQAQLTALTRDPYQTATSTAPSSATHWSRRIRAQLEFPWSGANVYGLPVGAGRLAATLGEGALRVEPLSLAVGEGQLTAAPNVRFDPEPAELSMPAGPIITNVRISPEVSEAMLKYVAPVLAGATQSEGLFSLKLDGMRVPLANPRRADSAGQLTVHSVRVVPGPMASQFVGLARQIEALAKRRDPAALTDRQVTLVSISDQQVNFRVADGRVYHQNLEFQVGDVVLRSQGSVGFDQTVSLTLQIPIQDAWVAKEPLLAGLKGQSLQVPVGGTLTKPQMDQSALTHLTGQLIQKGAGQAVGNELNKALDKFLKPR